MVAKHAERRPGHSASKMLRSLCRTRMSSDMWRRSFLRWTLVHFVFIGARRLWQGLTALVHAPAFPNEPFEAATSQGADAATLFLGLLSLFVVGILAGAAKRGASSAVLERSCFLLCIAQMLFQGVRSACSHHLGDWDSTPIYVACVVPMFRKAYLAPAIPFAWLCSLAPLFVQLDAPDCMRSLDMYAVTRELLLAIPLLSLFFAQTYLEDLQGYCSSAELPPGKHLVNKALVDVLCDGFAVLSADGKTILETDEKFEANLGGQVSGRLTKDIFSTDLHFECFLRALSNQLWPAPALVNVTLQSLDGRQMDAELFALQSPDEAASSAVVCLRLRRDGVVSGGNSPKFGVQVSPSESSVNPPSNYTFGTQSQNIFQPKEPSRRLQEDIRELGRKEHWYLDSERVQRIEPMQLLGHGAFGQVFLATLDGAVVACKVPASVESDVVFNELRTLRHLRHPYIGLFLGVTELPDTDKAGILFEYIHGRNLGDFTSRRRFGMTNIDADDIRIAFTMTAALRYMHSQKPAVFHGDLKPANIMVTQQDGRYVAKLVDFGLACIAVRAAEGTAIGFSARWSAPEVIIDNKILGESDVYSMGCTLCFALTGCSPYERQHEADIEGMFLKKSRPALPPYDWQRLHSLCAQTGIDKPIYDLLKRCTEYDIKLRTDIVETNEAFVKGFYEMHRRSQSRRPSAASSDVALAAAKAAASDLELGMDLVFPPGPWRWPHVDPECAAQITEPPWASFFLLDPSAKIEQVVCTSTRLDV
eukprot:TRINITY_DN122313_c0_g1_i1.p1 TRINITY_DN122313_c0_g1~~TRINITY_DN122313_c0_g1_i1.p1  ORF type:complete len:779 (-),score=96.80 TRINITY_DN122313_c0_g1_i1:8-2290(-)